MIVDHHIYLIFGILVETVSRLFVTYDLVLSSIGFSTGWSEK